MLQGEHSAILLIFIGLQFVIKIFVLSFFEWPFYTGFDLQVYIGILGRMWYLIVSTPDLCTLTYFYCILLNRLKLCQKYLYCNLVKI